jgi:ketosteroid isomerase-like protein
MSRGSVEAAYQQLSVRDAPRRRAEEHLGVHFPRLLALLTRAVMSLPPRSRLRCQLIRRVVQQGIEAANRRDYESAFALYHPQVEMVVPPDLIAMGFEPAVRGRKARLAFEVRWRTEWGDYSYEPEELRDLGDRILVAGRIRGSGPTSGAAFDREWANVFTISAGWVVHERVFFDYREALESVGLREAAPMSKD